MESLRCVSLESLWVYKEGGGGSSSIGRAIIWNWLAELLTTVYGDHGEAWNLVQTTNNSFGKVWIEEEQQQLRNKATHSDTWAAHNSINLSGRYHGWTHVRSKERCWGLR